MCVERSNKRKRSRWLEENERRAGFEESASVLILEKNIQIISSSEIV